MNELHEDFMLIKRGGHHLQLSSTCDLPLVTHRPETTKVSVEFENEGTCKSLLNH